MARLPSAGFSCWPLWRCGSCSKTWSIQEGAPPPVLHFDLKAYSTFGASNMHDIAICRNNTFYWRQTSPYWLMVIIALHRLWKDVLWGHNRQMYCYMLTRCWGSCAIVFQFQIYGHLNKNDMFLTKYVHTVVHVDFHSFTTSANHVLFFRTYLYILYIKVILVGL